MVIWVTEHQRAFDFPVEYRLKENVKLSNGQDDN